jgi:hypothetical protein
VIGIAGATIKTTSRLFYIAPLVVLTNGHYAGTFSAPQLQGLALMMLEVNDHGAAIAMIFFGFAALIKGWVVLRSTFLPKWLGYLTIVGGAGWLTYLSPPTGYRLFPIIAPVALLASVVTILWFLIKGVNEERWREQAATS